MIGLVVLIVVGIWCVIGWYLCRYLVTKRMWAWPLRSAVILVFWIVWLIGPIADEIVGRRVFDAACAKLPETKFYGPVHIGAGAFFDEGGARRWSNEREFSKIRIETHEWARIFEWRSEKTAVAEFPVPITRTDTTIYHVTSNTPSVSISSLLSTGGWIRRTAGWGYVAAWTCRSDGSWPPDEDRIIF